MIRFNKKQNIFYTEGIDRRLRTLPFLRRGSFSGKPCFVFDASPPHGRDCMLALRNVLPDITASAGTIRQLKYLRGVEEELKEHTRIKESGYVFPIEPYLHQLEDIETMLHYQRLALLLDMGLGKTLIALWAIDIRQEKAIILAPKITIPNWEISAKEYTGLKPIVYRGTVPQRRKLRERILTEDWDIIITNFESYVPRETKEEFTFFQQIPASTLVIDEAHRLRGHDSNRAMAALALATTKAYVYLLSGTISVGNPTSVFMPFKIMRPDILGTNYYKFEKKYVVKSKWNKHVVTGYRHLDKMKAAMDPYVIDRKRDETISIPDRVFMNSYYDLSPEQRKVYDGILNTTELSFPEGTLTCTLPIVKLNKLGQVLSGFLNLDTPRNSKLCDPCRHVMRCAKDRIFSWQKKCIFREAKPETPRIFFKTNPKLLALKDMLLGLNKNEKIIIWSFYLQEHNDIVSLLKKLKIGFITPDTLGCDKLYEAAKPEKIQVFTGQISKGIGITLNSATRTFYYKIPLDLEHYLQSLDRNARIGQTKKTIVNFLICENSIEPGILALLKRKEDVKDFMQVKRDCKTCANRSGCGDSTAQFKVGCIYFLERKTAEKKKKIKII